jgi:class 3 adenylate cyclase
MGDAVMAAFRLDRDDVPARSLAAVRQVHARLKEINAEEVAAGQAEIGVHHALHVGEVIYGNIGTATRLDFTVIGPAVNETARLEHLSREIGRHVVLSAAFVERAGQGDLVPLGEHRLRGREQPMAIFGLPEEENEPWSYIV